MSGARQRVEGQPAFVLHAHPYRETSLLVDVFSREWGRVPLVARGARRVRSALRGVLLAFQPLELGWFGAGEVRTLTTAEWAGGQPLLQGEALLCGYYLNELLIRLVPRDDSHPGLFDVYRATLGALAKGDPPEPWLRRFEVVLLQQLGYGASLEHDAATGEALTPDALYRYEADQGLVAVEAPRSGCQTYAGRTLLAIARGDYSEPETLLQCKLLMRAIIGHYLGDVPLQSRRVFRDLQSF